MTISAFFENDHREIDAIFAAIPFDQPGRGVFQFEEFDRRLERHIEWEEGILFPAVASKEAFLEMGPIRVMKLEHVEIRARKSASLASLRAGDGAAARGHAEAMLAVLKDHNTKEEHVLYPACDQLLDESERRDVLARVQAPAVERKGS